MKVDVERIKGTPEQPKALGAYYTDAQVADFLVAWAVRSKHDRVIDPSFGGGVFLRAAAKRIRKLRGQVHQQVLGIEIDDSVHRRISDKLKDEFSIHAKNLLLSDFFAVSPSDAAPFDVVVGNPPFIRYQRFAGDMRSRALECCRAAGVSISELSSSWVPFLIHSVSFLRKGGRLAMVVPAEIGHAAYALPLLEHLRRSFQDVTLLSFRKRLFPDISEDTLLLLADNRGEHEGRFRRRDLAHAGQLREALSADWQLAGTKPLDSRMIASGEERLIEYLLPRSVRSLYRHLRTAPFIRRLGELADVGIGYVTGANDFFHVGPDTAEQYSIPQRFLRRAVRRSRTLSGVRFTKSDWEYADRSYLVHLPTETEMTLGIRRFLAKGIADGVHRAYKCRTRSPWYRVPHVYEPDAFLTYMSGTAPRLVANDANAVAPNTLHILRLRPDVQVTGDSLAVLWQTSLSRLSSEIEGHPLGGGMLKLEPTEAESVLIPCPRRLSEVDALSAQLDHLIRSGEQSEAQYIADAEILVNQIGLSSSECRMLATAAEILHDRRSDWRVA